MNIPICEDKKQHIVVVGGGMVGISLALMLSKKLISPLISITLIEQYPLEKNATVNQPSFDDRSTALSSGAAISLRKLGCWSSLENKVESIQSVHVSDKGHFGGAQLDAQSYGLDALGYVVENKYMGDVLINFLQKSKVHCLAPAVVSHCRPKKAGYELQVDVSCAETKKIKQEKIDADLVLVADGANSPLRAALGITVEKKDYKQSALITNVALADSHKNIAYERFTNEGPIALLPLSSLNNIHRAALVWTLPEEKAAQFDHLSEVDTIALLQQRFGFRAGKITGIGQRHLYPLHLIKAQEQVRSHLAVVGNAAHFLHPVAGQGFNLALRDCEMLSECLLKSMRENMPLGHYSTLKQYVEKQANDQELTIGLTDSLVRLFSSSRLPKEVLRQLGLMSLNMLPIVKGQFAQKMMGLSHSL